MVHGKVNRSTYFLINIYSPMQHYYTSQVVFQWSAASCQRLQFVGSNHMHGCFYLLAHMPVRCNGRDIFYEKQRER